MLNIQARNFGTVAVLCLQGQIVFGETEILRNAVHSVSGMSAVKLDLAGVTTVDASGLGVLLELREQVESTGIRFQLMNLSKQIREVLAVTRLDSVFQIAAGVELFPMRSRSRRASGARLASCA